MAGTNAWLLVQETAGDQSTETLQDAMQQITEAMGQFQQDLHQQQQESLCQQEKQIHEALHQPMQDTNERMLTILRQQEERIREVLRQQTQEAKERMRQQEEALDLQEKRIEEILKAVQNKKPLDGSEERLLSGAENPTLEESGRDQGELKLLEGRMTKVEESVRKALNGMFPRVEALVAHLEESSWLQETLKHPPSIIFTSGPSSALVPRASAISATSPESQQSSANSPLPSTNPAHREALGKDLLRAARQGRLQDVLSLVDAGADVNYPFPDKRGQTPLMGAASYGETAVVSLLLQSGADLHATMCNGMTALHWSAMKNRSHQCVAQLLDAGARVDSEDSEGKTPLHWAAANGIVSAVQLLVQYGASTDVQDCYGMTPLDVTTSHEIICEIHSPILVLND